MGVSGMCLRIAPGTERYTLNVAANAPQQQQWYGILLTQGEPTDMMCPDDLLSSFGDFFSGSGSALNGGGLLSLGSGFAGLQSDCQASSGVIGNVNVRSAADQTAPIIDQIPVDATVPVLGSVGDFLLLDVNGTPGFALAPALAISGDCSQTALVTVNADEVSPTDGLIDLSQILRPDTNVGGLDPDALDLTSLTDSLGGLNLDAVADSDQSGGGFSLSDDTSGLNLDVDGSADDQPGATVSATDSSNGLNLEADANADDQPGVTVTGLDDSNDAIITADSSGADASLDSDGGSSCLNVLGVEINC
jgi:hypothetical protein